VHGYVHDMGASMLGGVCGHAGLFSNANDLAKLMQMYLQNGKWNDVQIIPEKWVEEATTKKIEQAPGLTEEEKADSDWKQGYCYKFWRSRHNSYRADGAYGQLILILPEQDAVIAVTAEVKDMQKELNMVWEYLLPAMSDKALKSNSKLNEQLSLKLNSLKLSLPSPGERSSMEDLINDKSFSLFEEKSKEKFTVDLAFENEKCLATFTLANEKTYVFNFGSGIWELGETNKPGTNLLPQPDENLINILPFKVAGAFSWIDENTLELALRYIESPHTEFYNFKFEGEIVSMKKRESQKAESEATLWKGRM